MCVEGLKSADRAVVGEQLIAAGIRVPQHDLEDRTPPAAARQAGGMSDPVPDALVRHVTHRHHMDSPPAPPVKPARWRRSHNIQITFMVAPALQDQLDAAARRHHVSRSTLMTWWLGDRLAQEPTP
jgi:hypothetical protein